MKKSKDFRCKNGHSSPEAGDCSFCEEFCWFPHDRSPEPYVFWDYLAVQQTKEEGNQWILINDFTRNVINLREVMARADYRRVEKHLRNRGTQ